MMPDHHIERWVSCLHQTATDPGYNYLTSFSWLPKQHDIHLLLPYGVILSSCKAHSSAYSSLPISACRALNDLLIGCVSFLKLEGMQTLITGTGDAFWVNPKCQLQLCWNDVLGWWCHRSHRPPWATSLWSSHSLTHTQTLHDKLLNRKSYGWNKNNNYNCWKYPAL